MIDRRDRRYNLIVLFAICVVLTLAARSFGQVVKITEDLGGGRGMMCSAVMISPNLALTAEHCQVTERATIEYDGKKFAVNPLNDPPVNSIDQAELLHVAGHIGDFTQLGNPPSVGDRVTAEGFPHGEYQKYSGRIVDIDGDYVYCDFLLEDGASGGGLFDESGYLIGIVSGAAWDVIRNDATLPSRFINLASVNEAMAYADETDKPTLVCFSRPNCPGCERFKDDYKAGRYSAYDVRIVDTGTHKGNAEYWETKKKVEKQTGKRYEAALPSFYVDKRAAWTVGYRDSRTLLDWVKATLRLPLTILEEIDRAVRPREISPVPEEPEEGGDPDLELGEPEPFIRSPKDDVTELKTDVLNLAGKVKAFSEAGVIGKVAMIPGLKSDVAKVKADATEARTELSQIKADFDAAREQGKSWPWSMLLALGGPIKRRYWNGEYFTKVLT